MSASCLSMSSVDFCKDRDRWPAPRRHGLAQSSSLSSCPVPLLLPDQTHLCVHSPEPPREVETSNPHQDLFPTAVHQLGALSPVFALVPSLSGRLPVGPSTTPSPDTHIHPPLVFSTLGMTSVGPGPPAESREVDMTLQVGTGHVELHIGHQLLEAGKVWG